jgi:DNA-binding NarL/FixJ family response regulator
MRKAAAAVWSGPLHNTAKDRPAKEPTRVLIVDDHPIVIAGCRALLADDAKIVITEAADAESGAASFTGRSARCLPYRYQLARRLRLRACSSASRAGCGRPHHHVQHTRRSHLRGTAIETKGYVSKSGRSQRSDRCNPRSQQGRYLPAAFDLPKPCVRPATVTGRSAGPAKIGG